MLSKAQGIVKPEEENILRIPVFLLYVTLCRNLLAPAPVEEGLDKRNRQHDVDDGIDILVAEIARPGERVEDEEVGRPAFD